jgi:transposase
MSGRPGKLPKDQVEIVMEKLKMRLELRQKLRELTLKKLGQECGVSLHVIHRAHRRLVSQS